jgi:hypothetical protein
MSLRRSFCDAGAVFPVEVQPQVWAVREAAMKVKRIVSFTMRMGVLAGLACGLAAMGAHAQTTFTCSTATPSSNCAMAIAGSATGTTTTPAGLSSSYLTVSGATGPVASVQVVLNGVTSSVADWAGYNENNENVYSSVFYTTFVLEDPAGNQLALLGSTGSGYDAMNGVTITIKDGATVAPPLNVPTTAEPGQLRDP